MPFATMCISIQNTGVLKMRITFLGTGSALPDKKRFSSCILVDINGDQLLFDCGPGTIQKLTQAGYDVNKIKYLFISHYHFDHMSDYMSLIFMRGVKKLFENVVTLNVYGPKGIKELTKTLFETIPQFLYMKEDLGYTKYTKINEMDTLEVNGWKVTCTPAEHPDTIAYKISAQKTIVYTSDTEPSDNIIEFAKDADMLIHECSYPEGHVKGHTTAEELGQVAKKANVKKLVLNHLYPICNGKEIAMVKKIKEKFDGKIKIAEDFMVVEL